MYGEQEQEAKEDTGKEQKGKQQQGKKQGGGGGGGEEEEKPAELTDEEGSETTATLELYDEDGEEIEIKDPSKITWAAMPANALKLEPKPDGSVKVGAVEGTSGIFKVTGTDPKSGESATGTVNVKSSKPKSKVKFG